MNGLAPSIENGAEVAMDILYDGEGSAIYFMMVEEDVKRIMMAPFTSIASDGSAVSFGENIPHLHLKDKSRLSLTEEMTFTLFVEWLKDNL